MLLRSMALPLLCLAAAALASAEAAPAPAAKNEPQVEMGQVREARVVSIKTSIWIDADPQTVWDHAVKDFDGWWPHCYKPDSHVFIEPWTGGRIWEQFGPEGEGGLYGNVLYLDEPNIIKCDGQWGMGGAAVSGGLWRMEAQDGGTLFSTSGEIMGGFGEEMNVEARRDAQADILLRLKRFCEGGPRIDRAAELAEAEREAAAAKGDS
ncbi:hypothetical protein IT575_02340 [bacterium]|nr:hypothetical protein [bacterium]